MATALEQLYEDDFCAWARRQARGLRRLAAARPTQDVDWPRLIEEVDDLAERERDAVRSQIRRILEHALKLELSPATDPRAGWVDTIVDARDVLRDKLSDTLRRDARARLGRLYVLARENAARRLRAHGEPDAAASLPDACPYTLDQVLDDGWFPSNRHGLPDVP